MINLLGTCRITSYPSDEVGIHVADQEAGVRWSALWGAAQLREVPPLALRSELRAQLRAAWERDGAPGHVVEIGLALVNELTRRLAAERAGDIIDRGLEQLAQEASDGD